jgi:hypothetical protein
LTNSYPDPRTCANAALQALEEAYVANFNSSAEAKIFTALKAIKQLQQSLDSGSPSWAENDPHEVNYENMAL